MLQVLSAAEADRPPHLDGIARGMGRRGLRSPVGGAMDFLEEQHLVSHAVRLGRKVTRRGNDGTSTVCYDITEQGQAALEVWEPAALRSIAARIRECTIPEERARLVELERLLKGEPVPEEGPAADEETDDDPLEADDAEDGPAIAPRRPATARPNEPADSAEPAPRPATTRPQKRGMRRSRGA